MRHYTLYIICVLFASVLPSQAQVGQRLFDDATFQRRFELAKRLNGAGHYVEAYDSLRVLHQDVNRTIRRNGMTAATVPDTKDFIFFQNVLTSEAECAYMVNLWKEMESLCIEQLDAINERYEKGLGRNKDYYYQVGSFYKVRGDYYYIRGIKEPSYYDKAHEDYKSALEFFELASDIQAQCKVFAELAQLEYSRGNYEDALYYIELANNENIARRSVGSNSKLSFSDAENISLNITYKSALAMCQARTYSYRKALNTIEDVISQLPKNDKRLPELKRRKAKILLLQNEENGTDIQDAVGLYESYFRAVKDSVNRNFMQMTADQREEYWMLQRPFVVDCYLLEERNPELLYDVTLYNKGMLLQTARSFDDLLYDEKSKGRTNEKKLLNDYRQRDVQNFLNGETTTLAADYEKKLLQTMNADGRRKKFLAQLDYTWKNVQKALPADGCAIEFVEYEKGNSMHFGALVLKKTGKPQFVYVCNADKLANSYMGGWFSTLRTLLQSTDGRSKNDIYENEYIKNSIWNQELICTIAQCRKVYFSADGYLHQLAIEYMLPEELQGKNFYRLSSTKVLAEAKKIDTKKIKNGAAFVLGGIRYDAFFSDNEDAVPGNDASAFKMLQEKGGSFNYMKGAKVECDSIVFYRDNPDDLYLEDWDATEQKFYENCSKYPILHISTHGCFSGDKAIYNELLASSTKDVLSESVMALSYADLNLHNSSFDAFNKDGLLSAREVARLNLENVELVTASACQTALGYITADGIYGMQRGFKSAGVKGMVMTLWSVNVESARIFFTSMYRYMAEGESVHSAFNHARNDLLTKTYTNTIATNKFSAATLSSRESTITTTNKYNTPQHANPYILIDVWE